MILQANYKHDVQIVQSFDTLSRVHAMKVVAACVGMKTGFY